jgi:hypothetical protein
MSQQDRKFPPLWLALFRSTAQMSRTCAALSLGVLPAPPACFITPPQSRCRPRLPAAPHRAPNRMFQLVVCGTSQSSKPDVPGVRVQHLAELQTGCSRRSCAAPHTASNQMFRWSGISDKLVAEQVVHGSTNAAEQSLASGRSASADNALGSVWPPPAVTASLPRRGRRHGCGSKPRTTLTPGFPLQWLFPARDGRAARGASALP